LRVPDFRWFFASRFVNTLGNMMAGVALAFAILELTDSPTALGLVLAAHTIPLLLFLLWGGVIADRFPRRLVILTSDVFSGLTQAAIALIVVTGGKFWMLVALSAVHGVISAMAFPTMASIVPQLVPHAMLQRANALISLISGGLAVVGPTVSGLLVVTIGPGWTLMADAFTWFAAAVLLLGVNVPVRAPRPSGVPGMLADLREGWTYFRTTSWLLTVVLVFGLLNAIQNGAIYILGPAVAKQAVGEDGWGLALSAEALGLIAMTIVILRVPLRRPLLLGMLGMATVGVPMFLLGVQPKLEVLVLSFFVAGAGSQLFSIAWTVAMQENVGEDMLARAYSYDSLGSYIAMPIGQLAFGPLGATLGDAVVLAVSGVSYVAICLLTLLSRSVRGLPRR
jgi:MFS family permease